MNVLNLKSLINIKKSLTLENKKKLLKILKECKISNKSILKENDIQLKNVIAKKFTTEADYDTYVAQHRGLEILPHESQAISNFDKVKPAEFSKFYVKYESTDEFSNNNTTVIKKLKQSNQLCWTAFSKNQSSNISEAEQSPAQNQVAEPNIPEENIKDKIEIIKSVNFSDEITGSKVLSDFLIKLDI